MDIQPTNQQSISDDQELAKVLAGVSQQTEDAVDMTAAPEQVVESEVAPEVPPIPEPLFPSVPAAPNGDLEAIKQEALGELRPLVDKLNVSPEEKFDTYLLLLRSTDDRTLIEPAYAAARGIIDEARRAQALLDTIKEIDYLSGPQAA
jgi:hypothetical protein